MPEEKQKLSTKEKIKIVKAQLKKKIAREDIASQVGLTFGSLNVFISKHILGKKRKSKQKVRSMDSKFVIGIGISQFTQTLKEVQQELLRLADVIEKLI